MRNALLILAVVFGLSAQTTTLTPTGPATATAGNSVTMTVAMTGSTGQSIAALQWSLTLPAGFTVGTPVLASGVPAGDVAYFGGAQNTFIVAGSTTAMTDGTVLTVPITIASTAATGALTIPITAGSIFAATTGGLNVNGMTAGTPYALKVFSPCDLNQDGSVNVLDVQLVVAAILGTGTCSVPGGCNIVTVQDVVIAALGGSCKVP
jgi:hypothetical protein